jgi:hypothetical protein
MQRFWLFICVLLAGCAGYRSGEVSQAYVDVAPTLDPLVRGTPTWLEISGARVRVELANEIQQREHQVMLFIVPVMVDPRDKPLYPVEQGARLLLEISPVVHGASFRPEAVVLTVDGREYRPSEVQRMAVFDPGEYPLDALRDAEPGSPANLDYSLDKSGRHHQFLLRFGTPMPAPTQEIRLDLSRALHLPGQPAVPPIRFRAVPWKQGYT